MRDDGFRQSPYGIEPLPVGEDRDATASRRHGFHCGPLVRVWVIRLGRGQAFVSIEATDNVQQSWSMKKLECKQYTTESDVNNKIET